MLRLSDERKNLDVRLDSVGEPTLMLDGQAVRLDRVSDRREPSFAVLFGLLLLFFGLLGGLGWFGLMAMQDDKAGTEAFARTSNINTAQQAFASAPIAKGDPAQIAIAPVRLQHLTHDEARILNASIPFSNAPIPAASRFLPSLKGVDALKATDCLAAAVWYEAGDDDRGQRAVAQVVINRLRHPAFPKTVCGVVFQGSERQTGCQFSFTCDGSMRRLPSAAAWTRARQIATGAMAGLVFESVGYATHYHTDWVAPYWSAKVDKIAKVGTHLFFRWVGEAGRPGAFTGRHEGSEPNIAKMSLLSASHVGDTSSLIGDEPLVAAPALEATFLPEGPAIRDVSWKSARQVPLAALRGNRLTTFDESQNSYFVALAPDALAGALALMALDLCSGSDGKACTVHGRLGERGVKDDFYYFRDASRSYEIVQWNCQKFERKSAAQCLPDAATP